MFKAFKKATPSSASRARPATLSGLKFGISERVVSSAMMSFVFIFKGCLLNAVDVATHKELHIDIVQIVSRSVVRSGALLSEVQIGNKLSGQLQDTTDQVSKQELSKL